MSLSDELRQMTADAVTTSPAIVNAFEHVRKYCAARAANGEHSCALNTDGHKLSYAQRIALKQRLTDEGLKLKEHSGDQRDPRDCAWTEIQSRTGR